MSLILSLVRHRKMMALLAAVSSFAVPSSASSLLSLGPKTLQTLVTQQLFDRNGRWYLIDDDGACFTYLESPRAHFAADRLILNAHLISRLGQRLGSTCAGADFASNVTVSGKLRALEHKLILEDIRIDRVDDESTRGAINLALQVDPQALPRTASVDVLELAREQVAGAKGSGTRLENLRITNVTMHSDAVVIDFDVELKAP